MPEMLDSSVIQHLILKERTHSGQIGDVVRSVAQAAVRQGLINVVPLVEYSNPLSDRIMTVMWELIMEGVYAPGASMQSPNLPFFHVTEYGLRCFEAGELTAHDPDDYLRRLKSACPSVNPVTMLYTGEALGAFRTGNHLAATVMIGVAAESMLLRLVDAVHGSLSTPDRQTKFEKETKGKLAKAQHDAVLARLRSPSSPLPPEIEAVLTVEIDGIYDLIRRTRNEAGHPTGRRMERYETHALLLLFPTYCKTVHHLIEWMAGNRI